VFELAGFLKINQIFNILLSISSSWLNQFHFVYKWMHFISDKLVSS